jgi:integrase
MFLAYYDTGMRKTDLRLLHRASLDLARKVVRLRPEDTKTGKGRVVPLTDASSQPSARSRTRSAVSPATTSS